MIYVEHSPHFSELKGKEKILDKNNELLYTTEDDIIINQISKNGNNICWFTNNLKNGEIKIYKALIKENKLNHIQSNKWDGKIDWNNGNILSIRMT